MKKRELHPVRLERIERLEDRVTALEIADLKRKIGKIEPPMPWPEPPDCEVES